MQQLHEIMHQLISLHESLTELSRKKTTQIKQGQTNDLAKLLMEERKQIQAITQAEEKREKLIDQWMIQVGRADTDRTMTTLLETMTDEQDKGKLESQLSQLIQVIVELREVELLNQQLLEQSMQFVQLSLDMLQPSIQHLNYDGKQQVQDAQKQSVFDSKA